MTRRAQDRDVLMLLEQPADCSGVHVYRCEYASDSDTMPPFRVEPCQVVTHE